MTFTRRPRAILTIAGDEIEGWLEIETEENEFSAPDSVRVTFGMGALPADRGPKWWSRIEDAEIEVFLGRPTDPKAFTTADLASVFVGQVDVVTLDWVERTITIDGRDKTGDLMDAKVSAKYVNLTASQIAEKIGAKYGLQVDATPTTTKAGRYYQIDHVDLQDERTEWDLLTSLAGHEGFVVYVSGRTLHFKERPGLDTTPTFLISRNEASATATESGNYEILRTERTLTVAGDISVKVRSWNAKQKKSFTKTASRGGRGGGKARRFEYTIPGLTADQAQKRADSILADLSRHAMRLSYEGPGRETLRISDIILLQGTGTDFDQPYYPERITRTISKDGGFRWSIDAKNRAAGEDE